METGLLHKAMCGSPVFASGGSPSQALPRQLSRRESQAGSLDAKVLGTIRKLSAVLLPLPLGEVSPQVTERAHAANPVAKVSEAIRNFPTMPRAPSSRELAKPSGFD